MIKILLFFLFTLVAFADVDIPYIPYWETVTYDGFDNDNNTEITALYEFHGMHFVGTYNQAQGGQVYVSTEESNFNEWTQVVQLPTKHTAVSHFIEYNGQLYLGTLSYTVSPPMQYRAALYSTFDGFNWYPVMDNGFGNSKNAVIKSLAVYNGQLYAGTSHSYAAQIYRSANGVEWEKVEGNGFNVPYATHIHSMVPYKGGIYASSSSGVVAYSANGERWAVSSKNFNRPEGGQPGGDDSALKISDITLGVYKDYLVAGATDRVRGATMFAMHPQKTNKQWVLASDFGIIGGNTDNVAIHWMTTVAHPEYDGETMLVAGTWGRNGASIFITTSDELPFEWTEVGRGGFNFYSMAPHVREVRRMGEYLYIALSGHGLYSKYPGKLIRIYLWNR